MNCKRPVIVTGFAFGCGQCIPCLVNKRREWTHRIMLEAQCHEFNAFLTLTYDNENLPVDGSVSPDALRLFMYKLRKSERPKRLRFYGVGEYGETDGRPHYHIAVFGMQPCHRVNTQVHLKYRRPGGEAGVCCEVCDRVRNLWAQGHTFVGQLEPRSAAYVAGYVTKKIGGPGLNGGHPPFARMSNRPGIGCFFMDEIASTILEYGLEDIIVDVPNAIRGEGRKKWPLGRYLRGCLRERIGWDKKAPEASLQELEKRMQLLREAAQKISAPGFVYHTIRGLLQDMSLGRRIQLEARQRRIDGRKTL